MIHLLGDEPLEKEGQAGTGSGGDEPDLPVELQFQEFLVEHQLHQLVHSRNGAGKAAQIGAYAYYLYVLQVEYVVVEFHQGAWKDPLPQVAQFDHQKYTVFHSSLLGDLVQLLHDAQLGVQGNVGVLDHLLEFAGVGRLQVPSLSLCTRFGQGLEVLEPGVGDGAYAALHKGSHGFGMAAKCLRYHREGAVVHADEPSHVIVVVEYGFGVNQKPVHLLYLMSAYLDTKPIRS